MDIQIPANSEYWIRTLVVATGGGTLSSTQKNYVQNSTGSLQLGVAGIGASAAVGVSSGTISFVSLANSGSGYPANTTIQCLLGNQGSGTGAHIVANIGISGLVDDFTIVSGGLAYSPSTTISVPGNVIGAVQNFAIPTDLTMTSGGGSTTFSGYGPCKVSGSPTDNLSHHSYIAIGDSITQGVYDTFSDWRAWPYRVHATYKVPILNLGDSGISAAVGYATNSKCWNTLLPTGNYSHAIIALGANDLNNGRTSAQLIGDLSRIILQVKSRGLTVDLCTITPHTDQADNARSYEIDRVSVNTWIRSKPPGIRNVYDIADALETSRNSGIWKPGYSYNGEATRLHPSPSGYDGMITAFSLID